MWEKSIPELLSLTFSISASKESNLSLANGWHGRAIQAIFLRSVEQSYSHSYAAILHIPNHLRPYSVSSLTKDNLSVFEENQYSFKICSLNQATSAALLACTNQKKMLSKGSSINISGNSCIITDWQIDEGYNYLDLLDKKQTKPEEFTASFVLELYSPFFFKETKTQKNISAPNNIALFKTLLEKWKRFSSIPEPAGFLEYLAQSVYIDKSNLVNVKIESGSFSRIGSMGQLLIQTDDASNESWSFLLSLARFANFAGIGKDTSTGFGQARFFSNQQALER